MKKLLVTVVGAVTALGAFAALNPATVLQFENAALGPKTIAELNTEIGNHFSASNSYPAVGKSSGTSGTGAGNSTYTVSEATISCPTPTNITGNTTKALDIKTTFGNPLEVDIVENGPAQDIDTGIYFDSLVKFTVCEDAPTQVYTNEFGKAKIVVWLQSEDGTGPTNLMVKAGSLTYAAGAGVTAEPTTYTCQDVGGDFADGFHRVTIKAIANITTDTDYSVPGFAIYIDGSGTEFSLRANNDSAKFDNAFAARFQLTGAAKFLNTAGALFPSLVQGQTGSATQLTKAGFDGTGSITDIVFTSAAPDFAADQELEEPVATVKIGDGEAVEVTSFADAVGTINNATSAAKLTLAKGLTLEEPMSFSANVEVTLDFAGFVLTNESEFAAITNSALKLIVTDSAGTGGINCTSTGAAIYQTTATFPVDEETVNSELAITGGNFWGENIESAPIVFADGEYDGKFVSGGAFADAMSMEGYLVAGKVFANEAVDGLYAVIDKPVVNYTITFVYGMPAVSNQQTVAEGDLPQVPTAVDYDVEGWEFKGWDVTPVAAVANATYTAQYEPNSWAAFLGAAVNGAYEIDNLAELVKFKDGVAKLGTAGQNFRLTADIDAGSLEYWDGIGTASGTIDGSATSKKGLNSCTFDGAGHTISNVKFTNAKYRGFFNQVLNSTIKDLTINVVDIAQPQSSTAEHGYSAFAGNMKDSKIQNCVATGTIGTTAKPAMHTCGGFAVKSDGGNVFENCTNRVNIVCSLTDNPKIGGIFGLGQTAASALTNCWNFGTITITCKTCDVNANGAGGLVGYTQADLTIHGGGNAGTVQSTDTTTSTGTCAVKVGAIIGMQLDNDKTSGVEMTTVSGDTVAQADAMSAGAIANINGLSFATVNGNVATFVKLADLAAGNTYKVMATNVTATFKFTAAGTIAFDTALATPTFAITADEGLEVTSATVGTVTTYTAAAKTPTVDPTGTGTIDCTSATEAASVAEAINAAKETYITKPSTVADATTYYSYVQAVADGTAVKVALTAAGEAVAQASANTDVAQLPVANAAAADAEASIDSVAGLYYSILSGTAPTAVTTEGTRVVGNGGKITLTLPKQTGAAGFYKVKVSATAQ